MNDPITTHINDYKYRPQHAWCGISHKDNSKYYTDGHMMLKRSVFPRPLKRMLEPLASDWKRYNRIGNEAMDRLWNGQGNMEFRNKAKLSNTVTTDDNLRKDSTVLLTCGDDTVILDADKVKFIMTRCGNLSFWITDNKPENNPVVIKSGRKKIGIIMPRRA